LREIYNYLENEFKFSYLSNELPLLSNLKLSPEEMDDTISLENKLEEYLDEQIKHLS
jgi:hypothetical protein